MPYISYSKQKVLDKEHAETELARKELLQNDFCDRALQNMMNGVLEIRWEDEIKKQPRKPRCLELGLNPKDYLDEDLKTIAAYEEKIQHLNNERKRYHDMLLEEMRNIQNELDVKILDFNRDAAKIFRKKLRVEFAINAEELKLLLYSKFNFERIELQEKEGNLMYVPIEFTANPKLFHIILYSREEKESLRAEIDELTRTMHEIEINLNTCKIKYEELSVKDRLLDRQFKTTFAEHATQAVVDQACRVFR